MNRIRRLLPSEEIPSGEPRRYRSSHGYIRLRWLVAAGTYVEEYEHRIVAGRPASWLHVHHLNGDKADNRPENLQVMTAAEHQRLHDVILRESDPLRGHRSQLKRDQKRSIRAAQKRERLDQMRTLYRSGLSTIEVGKRIGLHHTQVYRQLAAAGVRMRSSSDYATVVDAAELAAKYTAGRSLPSLAAEYRITGARVRALLTERCVKIRRPGRPKVSTKAAENAAREAVRRRSRGRCEVCNSAKATNYQHRKNKSQGGDWSVVNGLDVCGNGNATGCHGRIHQNPTEAYDAGWSVRRNDDPATKPVLVRGARVLLTPDGGYKPLDVTP